MVLKFRNIDTSDWSPTWKSSEQPRKQRKYLINAPIHIRRKIMVSPLSKELKKLLKIRAIPIVIGDYVKVLRGKFRNSEGYIVYVDAKRYRVYVDSAKFTNKKGKEVYYPIHYSKVEILKLNLTDKKRIETIKRRVKDESLIEKLLKDYSVKEEDVNKAKQIYSSIK